ncbi:MAG: hypothetical protein QM775_13265 [Pirellulales bacterium]
MPSDKAALASDNMTYVPSVSPATWGTESWRTAILATIAVLIAACLCRIAYRRRRDWKQIVVEDLVALVFLAGAFVRFAQLALHRCFGRESLSRCARQSRAFATALVRVRDEWNGGHRARRNLLRRAGHQLVVYSAVVATLVVGTPAAAAEGFWNVDAAGNWNAGGNWAGGVIPNGVDDIANFRNDITANRTVTLNTPVTLGGLRLGDALGTSVFTFAGAGPLTFDVTSGNAFLSKFNGTTDIWQAPVILNDRLDANIFAGVLDVNGASNAQVSWTGSGDVVKNGVGSLNLNITTAGGYTGNWLLNLGTINLGGANGATVASLGTGTGGVVLRGTGSAGFSIFSLNNNGTASDSTVTWTGNNNFILQGAATLNVGRNQISGANDRVTHVINNLRLDGGILSVTSGNSHTLRVDGVTTLVGDTSVLSIAANATATRANLILNGQITDGAVPRAHQGRRRTVASDERFEHLRRSDGDQSRRLGTHQRR